MAETRTVNEEYGRIGAKLIANEPSLEGLRESSARIAYLSSDAEKKSGGQWVHAECEKVPAKWQWAAPYDFIVTVYEPNTAHLSPEQLRILLHHELLHAEAVKKEDGGESYRIRPHDVGEFAEIIELYGLGWDE